MESLKEFSLGGTAIKELPSSTIHLKSVMYGLSFKGCQLSSSSLTSMPGGYYIDLSDCNLSAIPSGIDRHLSEIPIGIDRLYDRHLSAIPSGINGYSTTTLYLSGNDFVSLPERISQFSRLTSLYLDGCKSLRSLSNIQIPSTVKFICADNCTLLERLPEVPEPSRDVDSCRAYFTVQCFNCFKLAENFENFSNMFQVSLSLISVRVF